MAAKPKCLAIFLFVTNLYLYLFSEMGFTIHEIENMNDKEKQNLIVGLKWTSSCLKTSLFKYYYYNLCLYP